MAINLSLDGDDAGRKATDTIREKLTAAGVAVRVAAFPAGIKDANELLVSRNGDAGLAFRQVLDMAHRFKATPLGFRGALTVLLLYGVTILRVYRLAAVARDGFAGLMTIGVVTALFFTIMVNMLMTVGWAPVTGIPLPLLSYGGTALLVSCVQIGLLQNVALRRREY